MTAASSTHADEIQRQMKSVRSLLREDVKELVENARDMTDWHYYVRRYPWLMVAAAVGAGFVLVPTRQTRLPSAPSPSPPVGSEFSFVSPAPSPPQQEEPSMIGRLASNAMSAATSALSRAAMGFISQQVTRLLAEDFGAARRESKQGDPHHAESHFGT